jgi:hypothetical protein
MYPLFIYCYVSFVKKHKNSVDGKITFKKVLVILWIYFLFLMNVVYNLYSIFFRVIRDSHIMYKPWFLIMHAIMYSFFQPVKDFLTSLTLVYLVYT